MHGWELAEIQRRLYRNQGPAVLFTNVKNCAFPMLAIYLVPYRVQNLCFGVRSSKFAERLN